MDRETETFQTLLSPRSTPGSAGGTQYAKVLVNVNVQTLQDRIFTYRVPEEYADIIEVGQPVLVSFGAQQDLTGFVTELAGAYEGSYKLKEIGDLMDETPLFDATYYDFIRWVSDYYATPVSQVLQTALPANLIQKAKKVVTAGPHLSNPLALAKIQHEKSGRKALELVDFLYRNTPDFEEAQRVGAKGYSPRYLANRLRLPFRETNRLLARLKTLGIVQVETELSGKTAPRMIRLVRLTQEFDEERMPDKLTPRQREIMAFLRDKPGGLPLRQLLETLGTTLATVKKLETSGLLTVTEVEERRDPLALYRKLLDKTHFTLSPSQQQAMDAVEVGDNMAPYLLYGVTGSGKTEVYMSLARRTLEEGRSVLVMVPEIALTSQIARRFISHFGAENIALWHSNLSDGEKADTWQKLRSGELKILIGARSAIWAPMKNLGMILIDEEHEGSYKQDSPAPRYHAKTLALELARRTGAKVVLGSATPEVASFYEARKNSRILHLRERFGGRQLADVRIVDMKQEHAHGSRGQLSRTLREELERNLEAGEQSIILLNRRGFYTIIQCSLCDYVFMCPNCDVAVTYHRSRNMVCCHYCGYEAGRPQYCPVCAGMDLDHSGVGTQRIEAEIVAALPGARVVRLDSDIMQKRHAHREIFEAYSAGEIDILVGTQIVAKGLDVANVTLVGVISADSAFMMPDYKSAERGFQLLTQVAGRAGRGEKPGRVIIQSVQTQHMVLQHAQRQDYDGFYEEEITQRETSCFPPFSQLFRFIVSCENETRARQFIETAAMHLRQVIAEADADRQVRLMGPAPCVLPRIQGKYRYHLLVRNTAGEPGRKLVAGFYRRAMEARLPDDLHFMLDIDAQSLL